LLPGFANAKPLPEAGNNDYLGSECDYLPEADNIYIGPIYWPLLVSIHPPIPPPTHPPIRTCSQGYWIRQGHLAPRLVTAALLSTALRDKNKPVGRGGMRTPALHYKNKPV